MNSLKILNTIITQIYFYQLIQNDVFGYFLYSIITAIQKEKVLLIGQKINPLYPIIRYIQLLQFDQISENHFINEKQLIMREIKVLQLFTLHQIGSLKIRSLQSDSCSN